MTVIDAHNAIAALNDIRPLLVLVALVWIFVGLAVWRERR